MLVPDLQSVRWSSRNAKTEESPRRVIPVYWMEDTMYFSGPMLITAATMKLKFELWWRLFHTGQEPCTPFCHILRGLSVKKSERNASRRLCGPDTCLSRMICAAEQVVLSNHAGASGGPLLSKRGEVRRPVTVSLSMRVS